MPAALFMEWLSRLSAVIVVEYPVLPRSSSSLASPVIGQRIDSPRPRVVTAAGEAHRTAPCGRGSLVLPLTGK